MTFKEELKKIQACKEAVEWVGDRTLEQAWNECERGDWMLWLAQTTGVDLRILTLAKARCAKLVVHLMKDDRSRDAVEVAERFGLGNATREELNEARADAAYAAAAAVAAHAVEEAAEEAAAAAAAHAAYTAADGAAHAVAHAVAAHAVAHAVADAAAAEEAAAHTAYAAARKNTLRQCADICRKILTDEILVKEES